MTLTTKVLTSIVLSFVNIAAAMAAGSATASPALPATLQLNYSLRYGGLEVGRVVKTLKRNAGGGYEYRSHSKPMGAAKMFTSVQWFEEGEFEIHQGRVRPLSFLEYRVGADKPHRHSAFFDWKAQKINYAHGATLALPTNTQDQGSLLFAFMLHPPTAGGEQAIHVSSGKKLRVYRYAFAGNETLKTALGTLKTIRIERPATGQDEESFQIWLAPERNNIPVRITTQKRGQETSLDLESVTGL